jgi:hypothetical protein
MHKLTFLRNVQMGLASEGIEDLAAGLVTGGTYLGGAIGPVLGGTATLLFGSPWAATIVAGLLLLHSGVLAAVVRLTRSLSQSRVGA